MTNTPSTAPLTTGPLGTVESDRKNQATTATSWVLLRLAGAAFVLWAVATIAFFALRLVPGDPVDALLGGPGSNATEEVRQQTRELHGLDRPVVLQYGAFLLGLFRGDLGESHQLRQPVAQVLSDQMGNTLLLAALALVLAWVFALGLALWSVRSGRIAAAVANFLEIVSAAVPHFWLGTILILVFSVNLQLLPTTSGNPGVESLVLPVVTLAVPLAGFLGQSMRESMLTAMHSPFALSSRARGESETGVSLRHALRHAALPGINLTGWAFGSLISGAVVVETVFARPGLGRTLLEAVVIRDVPVVLGVVLLIAAVYAAVMLLSDIAERLADPRLRDA